MKFQGDSRVIPNYLAFVYRTYLYFLIAWIAERTLVPLTIQIIYKKKRL